MLLSGSDRMWFLLRMSVLSRLAASGVSSLRWSPLDTTSGLSAWALGRSEALKDESGGGLWATPLAHDTRTRSPANRANPNGGGGCLATEVIEAGWQTPTSADGGSISRGGDRVNELLLGGQVKAANWQTRVAEDKEQSGSAARGPSQTSQVRESEWATANARDWKDAGMTQGNRKSPNLGTQANLADGPTSCG